MKKRLLSAILALAMLIALAACGGASTSTPPANNTTPPANDTGVLAGGTESKEVVEVVFWDMMSGNEKYPALAEAQAAKITEEYPNIKIKYQSIPWANRYETFTTAIAAGEAPDFSNGGGYQSFQFYEMGEILDVAPIIKDWEARGILKNYNMDLINYFQVDGAQVGVPTGVDPRLVIYRKDWFDAAGIAAPKTWDDIYAAAKHFTNTAEGTYGMVYPCEGADGNLVFMMWPNMNGTGVWSEDGKTVNWNNPANVEAVNFIRKLNDEGLVPPGMSAYTNAEVIQMCSQDKAAMAIITSGNAGSKIAEANAGWAYLPTPAGPSAKGNNAAVGSMNAYMAYKQTEHPEETMIAMAWWAENFIDLIMNPEAGVGGVPPRYDWQNDPAYLKNISDPFLRDYILGGNMESTHTLVYPAANIDAWLAQNAFDAERWWTRLSQAVLTTKTPADELLQGMQSEAEALIKQFYK